MPDKKHHAEFHFVVDRDALNGNIDSMCTISGCSHHLIEEFADTLTKNPTLKDFINKVIRAANEIKGRTQN